MKIEIYTRNEQGHIEYLGDQGWDSRAQVLEHYYVDDVAPEREPLIGWHHPAVTWHGLLGFGERA